MKDWITFEGRVIPLEWGGSVYTVLPLPDDVHRELAAQSARRVDVELNDCLFNLALTKAPVIDQVFLHTGKRVLAEASIKPGDVFDVRLRKADPTVVPVPDDVVLAIRQTGLIDAWNSLTPGKRRGLLHSVVSARQAHTRAVRIARLMDQLSDM